MSLADRLRDIALKIIETSIELKQIENENSKRFEEQTIGWIDKRTVGFPWAETILVSNPEYIKRNGEENFLPLFIKREE